MKNAPNRATRVTNPKPRNGTSAPKCPAGTHCRIRESRRDALPHQRVPEGHAAAPESPAGTRSRIRESRRDGTAASKSPGGTHSRIREPRRDGTAASESPGGTAQPHRRVPEGRFIRKPRHSCRGIPASHLISLGETSRDCRWRIATHIKRLSETLYLILLRSPA